jgi:hypothetical protein
MMKIKKEELHKCSCPCIQELVLKPIVCPCGVAAAFDLNPRLWLVADPHDHLRAPIENLIARTVTHDVMKVSPEVSSLPERGEMWGQL